MKFASIDIGSNAVRLLFTKVFEDGDGTVFKKDSLVRMPIRLGKDVFNTKKVSKEKIDNLVNTMIAFKYLIDAYNPIDYKACATSAMREAANRNEIVRLIKKKSDIDVEIIDGKREAEIIYENHIAEKLNPKKNYLYIDVGGGSTELTLISRLEVISSQSFDIGTVRILEDKVTKSQWQEMKGWIEQNTKGYKSIAGIGSGGNINKIFKMSLKKGDQPLSYKNIKSIYKTLDSYGYEERITKLGLRPDRADVIIPAAKIYLSVLKWADSKKLYVPQIGLSDGIIHVLYEKHKRKHINL
ncbi:MAG: exopolyphosphatase [Candidatus Dadabacteria bacterium]|nr:exopolyphosphatase [Candidatus Dadabacteria bacterium]NIS09588.1 exopolyphosphatase [Candidatus Dadabacteria bacterium]NIV43123.1 exopolyphosphatase [Candidatus Dadabacteria bacterium]NIX16070.1 exopolyphosphatase [Candidatus Dadabacteria bacterium]NIY22765.1 exopolyphosphatase [Candidatus Dadabacteria bacterium]